MRLILQGHDCRYAVEQIMLTLFPDERPVYAGGAEEENSAVSALRLEGAGAVCHTCITLGTRRAEAEQRAEALPPEGHARTSVLQKIVKLSFFDAAAKLLPAGQLPPWGALTGIRPAKLAARFVEAGRGDLTAAAQYLQQAYHVAEPQSLLCADAAACTLEMKRGIGPRTASLYVGIPFCPSRCSYCSFVSQSVEKSLKLIEPYLAALHRELAAEGDIARQLGLQINAVYIGGGTPTTLSAGQLAALMAAIGNAFDLSVCVEYTVEAGRPDTITAEKLTALQQGGATRVSINPQTMSDTVLAAIGRRHSADAVRESLALARAAGFSSVNMDLIAGLPSDSVAGFQRSLDAVMALGPENITVHTLARKRGSRISEQGADAVPSGAAVGEMLRYAARRLYAAGYKPYYMYRQKYTSGGFENIGWSISGHEGLYNVCMMEELCSVLSAGAGGVTKLVKPASGRIERIINKKYPLEYIASIDGAIREKDYIAVFDGEER